ncbi:unnamed protein product [Clonostachys rosea]|uniref:Uncharacterized protein n=1 Tax=Bionectria ochroleuca TaxID=29856 RepID=A0ABY6UJD3_BIOOC|nr:unnamed protein product [Clonostachys rosea]
MAPSLLGLTPDEMREGRVYYLIQRQKFNDKSTWRDHPDNQGPGKTVPPREPPESQVTGVERQFLEIEDFQPVDRGNHLVAKIITTHKNFTKEWGINDDKELFQYVVKRRLYKLSHKAASSASGHVLYRIANQDQLRNLTRALVMVLSLTYDHVGSNHLIGPFRQYTATHGFAPAVPAGLKFVEKPAVNPRYGKARDIEKASTKNSLKKKTSSTKSKKRVSGTQGSVLKVLMGQISKTTRDPAVPRPKSVQNGAAPPDQPCRQASLKERP